MPRFPNYRNKFNFEYQNLVEAFHWQEENGKRINSSVSPLGSPVLLSQFRVLYWLEQLICQELYLCLSSTLQEDFPWLLSS